MPIRKLMNSFYYEIAFLNKEKNKTRRTLESDTRVSYAFSIEKLPSIAPPPVLTFATESFDYLKQINAYFSTLLYQLQ